MSAPVDRSLTHTNVLASFVVAVSWGCGNPTATPRPRDNEAGVPDATPGSSVALNGGVEVLVGSRHAISVVVMQPRGRPPLLSEATVRKRLDEAEKIAQQSSDEAELS